MEHTPSLLDLPARTAVRWICLTYLWRALRAHARLRDPEDVTALHDFRVALRRLRGAMRAYRGQLGDTPGRRRRRAVRDALRESGAGRDREVMAEWIDTLLPDDPARAAACQLLLPAGLAAADRGRWPAGFARLAARLGRELVRYQEVIDPSALHPPERMARALGAALEPAADELRVRLTALDRVVGVEAAHRARLAAKRLRYLLEPVWQELEEAPPIRRALKRLQTLLGELHDLDVLGEWVAQQLAAGTPDARALLPLARRIRTRRDDLAGQLRDRWLDPLAGPVLDAVQALATRLQGPPADTEIERKYLLHDLPRLPVGTTARELEQGWFGNRLAERVRRVRGPEGERYFRAVKVGRGIQRIEVEEEIDGELFAVLWPLTEGRRVLKRRHAVEWDGLTWEVDEFTDRALVLAEVELPAPEHPVQIPDWMQDCMLREVTGEPEYINLRLAR